MAIAHRRLLMLIMSRSLSNAVVSGADGRPLHLI